MQKPLLPVGYEIDWKVVKKRHSRMLNCEVYELTKSWYLYVFTDINPDDVLKKKRKKYDMISLWIWLDDYLAVFMPTVDSSLIDSIKRDLTTTIWFESIAGMDWLKEIFMQEVVQPIKDPEKYKKYKLSIPNGVLFFWPPGCGKTFMSRKLAEEIGYNFYEIKHSDIASPFIHGSTGKIGEVFALAKENSPSIVFFDELSGLVPKREDLSSTSGHKEEEINEFLIQLNDASKNHILVIWATNYPDRIDTAIMRAWRMDKRIYIWPPDFSARVDLFKMYLQERPTKKLDYEKLGSLTEGYVSSDIQVMCDNFARKALSQDSDITMKICEDVIKKFSPSISEKELEFYESFVDSYQRI